MIRLVATSILPIILLFATPAWAGPIYVYKDGNAIKFSSKPPPAGVRAEVFTGGTARTSFFSYGSRGFRKLYKSEYGSTINKVADDYGVDPHLIRAVIHAESGFNPRARSPKGAQGLMQLMPGTSRMLGVHKPYEPEANIHGGVKYLAFLLKRYGGNLKHTLAAYNAGPEAVERYKGIPPYRETRDYVRSVLDLRERYKKAATK